MVPVSAVREPAQPVVPPGPREKDAAEGDARLRREAAVSEVETIRLGERMGRRRDEADIARVPERPQFTPVEQGFAAAGRRPEWPENRPQVWSYCANRPFFPPEIKKCV